MSELWIRFGAGTKVRNIPLHIIAEKSGFYQRNIILKARELTGCDFTIKVGTKYAALKVHSERFLHSFGVGGPAHPTFQLSEKYLVKVCQMTTKCETFDELRYQTFLSKNKTLPELSPTSHSIKDHLLRSHYIVNQCLNLMQAEYQFLNPFNFGWTLSNGYMMPEKYECFMPVEYTVTCGCQKGYLEGAVADVPGNFAQITDCSCNDCTNKYLHDTEKE